MVQSPSWEANWFAASQEIPRILWNSKVHYRTHRRPPPVPILGHPNPVHMPTSHLLEIHPNIIHPSTPRSPQWSLSLRFPHQDRIRPPLLTHTCKSDILIVYSFVLVSPRECISIAETCRTLYVYGIFWNIRDFMSVVFMYWCMCVVVTVHGTNKITFLRRCSWCGSSWSSMTTSAALKFSLWGCYLAYICR